MNALWMPCSTRSRGSRRSRFSSTTVVWWLLPLAACGGAGEAPGAADRRDHAQPLETCTDDGAPLTDPGSDSARWDVVGGGIVDNEGEVAAVFAPLSVCRDEAMLLTTVDVPCRPSALVGETSIATLDTSSDAPAMDNVLRLGGARLDVLGFDRDGGICLGAAALGKSDVPLVFSPRVSDFSACEGNDLIELRRLHLVEDNGCPSPGTSVPLLSFALRQATIAADQLRFELSGPCDFAQALSPPRGAVSFPEGPAALLLTVDGDVPDVPRNPDEGLAVEMARRRLHLKAGVNRICALAAQRGTVVRANLRMTMDRTGFNSCDEPTSMVTLISAPVVVADDTCGDGFVFDGDMEDPTSPWWSARAVFPSSEAFINAGKGTLVARKDCDDPSLSTTISVPSPDESGGPALRFHYDLAAGARVQARVELGSPSGSTNLTGTNAGGRDQLICLPVGAAGSLVEVVFRLDAGGGSCADDNPAVVTLNFDNVEVATDAACP